MQPKRAGASSSCLAAWLLWGLVCGCSAFDDLKLKPAECDHARVPLRPSRTAGSTVGAPPFTAALRTIDFGDSNDTQGNPRWRSIGFDLDDQCTEERTASGCADPAWTTVNLGDGPAGRDNALGAMTLEGRQFAGSVSDLLSNDMASGADSLAIRVSNYNGLNDDDQLRVEVIGIRFPPGAQPEWTGTDVWLALGEFVVVSGIDDPFQARYAARYFDDSAYVKDHWLVANFEEVGLAAGLVLSRGVMVARIVRRSGGGWTLADGTFGGRANFPQLLGMGKYFRDVPLCRGSPLYEPIFKPLVCRYADIGYSTNDPSLPCDGVSVGFNFAATSAQVSNDVDFTKAETYCTPDETGLPPGGDTCDSLAAAH